MGDDAKVFKRSWQVTASAFASCAVDDVSAEFARLI
jgi:hypothetical protein